MELSNPVKKNRIERELKNLLRHCDLDTSRHYAIVKSYLKSKGTPIPENDIWIAALAKQHRLTLVTRDKHFNNIHELLLESW